MLDGSSLNDAQKQMFFFEVHNCGIAECSVKLENPIASCGLQRKMSDVHLNLNQPTNQSA